MSVGSQMSRGRGIRKGKGSKRWGSERYTEFGKGDLRDLSKGSWGWVGNGSGSGRGGDVV